MHEISNQNARNKIALNECYKKSETSKRVREREGENIQKVKLKVRKLPLVPVSAIKA